MPQYKLMYFNVRGRAEMARMLFALKGQEFEDYRFKEGEWGEVKGDKDQFPQGQVPVLLIDGKSMPQGRAIAQMLARDFGFYGASNCEAAKIDVIHDTVEDIMSKFTATFFEKDETKKAEGLAKSKDTTRPFFTFLNDEIKNAGGKYFVGNSETLGDIVVYCMLDAAAALLGEDFLKENYPYLVQFRQWITDKSNLSKYIKTRPQTKF